MTTNPQGPQRERVREILHNHAANVLTNLNWSGQEEVLNQATDAVMGVVRGDKVKGFMWNEEWGVKGKPMSEHTECNSYCQPGNLRHFIATLSKEDK